MFKRLTFEEAVDMFEQWGFQVKPGPQPEEVTLILEGPDYRTYTVYEARRLSQIADVALQIRWQNGALAIQTWEGRPGIPVNFETIPFPLGAASLLRH